MEFEKFERRFEVCVVWRNLNLQKCLPNKHLCLDFENQIQYNLYYPTLLVEEQLVRIIEGSDNRRAKTTALNGVWRVGLRSDN